jgi:hypothetical protein
MRRVRPEKAWAGGLIAVGAMSALAGASVCACSRPFLARDGTLIFPEKGAHGASVVTANGIEFHDVADVPDRVVVRDPYEPWRAPLGFLVPANGRFTKTSVPTLVATRGLAVSLRPSDTRVPAWGGEMLVRVDILAPAAEGTARWGEDVAIVLDGRSDDLRALAQAAVDQLGGRDRVEVVDARAGGGASVVVPVMPASHRSLVMAAIERTLASPPEHEVDPPRALRMALEGLSQATRRRVLVLSDDAGGRGAIGGMQWTGSLADDVVPFQVIAADAGNLEARVLAVKDFVPPSGATEFGNLVLAFDGTPAPAHVIEASGGDKRWQLEGGELALGDVRAGEERAEVIRVTVPAWTAGEPFTLHVTARFDDVEHGGAARTMGADLRCTYDDDVERLAGSRHGDVIAYASALATLSRLDAAFVGGSSAAGLRSVAQMHARSLALLARDMHDPAAAEQAALLDALLAAVPKD